MESIPKEHFVHMNAKQLDKFIDKIVSHYRREGFPFFPTNKGYRQERFNELRDCDINNLIQSNFITRTQHGINLAWSYFPHAFSVRCSDMITPMEAFNDEVIFRKLIKKACTLGDSMSDSTVRGLLRLYSGVQAVSNFRPTAAAALYDHYALNGTVWDMSGGWGGRLLGAMRGGVLHYIATEPSALTHKGLIELGNDFKQQAVNKNFTFEILKRGSEDYRPAKNSLDFCFTSPPYFDLEQYADEATQSFKKFDSKKKWVEGFLLQTIDNCYHGLKKNKYMAVNIADPKKQKGISLELETINCAKRVGFTHVNTLQLILKSPLGSGALYKLEPIFIFKKAK
jgi:hypothetical protein